MEWKRCLKTALVLVVVAWPASAAQGPAVDRASQRRESDLADMSLEELMNMNVIVTSVARKEMRLFESPAAVTVITAQAIRRSGLATLPELLRTVPGLAVARINSSEWAITSRGFNDQYASKLLVLVDGRTIYTPMFSGVYWNANDIVLEDVERIEVIRGPGAALWGANAVNGVINIITKDAAETHGGLVAANYGTEEQPAALLRYGSTLGPSTSYRVYLKNAEHHGVLDPTGENPADDWRSTRVGLRLDGNRSPRDHVSAQAEYYRASVGEHFERVSLTPPLLVQTYPVHDNTGGHALVRWRREFSDTSSLTLQSYYDRFHQWDGDIVESRDTLDFDMQRQQRAGKRQDLLWGLGYRYSSDSLPPTFYLTFFPAKERTSLYTGFLQDEITLLPKRVALTLGVKLEHNDFTGYELQPSTRLSWKVNPRQFAWASVSRAVRTPGRFHFDSRLNASVSQAQGSLPFLVSLIASPDAVSEELLAYEAGYRVEPTRRWSVDLATYYNQYDHVFTYVTGAVAFEGAPEPAHLLLPLYQRNLLHGHSYGGEVSTRWAVTDRWQLSAGYSRLRVQLEPTNSSAAKDPRTQWQMRSDVDLPRELQVNAAAYYVSRITSPLNDGVIAVGSYLRVDTSVHWRLRPHLELVVQGQNLLNPRHAEFGSFKTSTLAEIPRTVKTGLTWVF